MHNSVSFLVLQSSLRGRERELVALLVLSYRRLVTVNVLWLYLTVPWVGLQSVIVVFYEYTHLLFYNESIICYLLSVGPQFADAFRRCTLST